MVHLEAVVFLAGIAYLRVVASRERTYNAVPLSAWFTRWLYWQLIGLPGSLLFVGNRQHSSLQCSQAILHSQIWVIPLCTLLLRMGGGKAQLATWCRPCP